MEVQKFYVERFLKERWLLHVIFWLIMFFLYVLFFGRQSSNYPQTLMFVGLLMPIAMGASYFLNYRLIPNYLLKARYKKFIAYFLYTILTSLYAEMLIVILIFISLADVQVGNMTPASIDIFFLLLALLMVVLLAGAIKLFKYWIESRDRNQRLSKEKAEAELKFLKTQLNPHFLFNTLNNLYYLAIEKSDHTPAAILALSEILDYILHSAKRSLVPLPEELKQMENYIALELMRYQDRVEITRDIDPNLSHFSIAPITIISLVENAFKHGVEPNAVKSWIHIQIREKNNSLHVHVENSRRKESNIRGIGLENLRNQLHLLYEGNFSLVIRNQDDEKYSITLILPPSNEV